MEPERHLEDSIEFAENPEPRCPCVLLLDTSGSMQGDRLDALHDGLHAFRDDVMRDSLAARRIEVAIVTFDSKVRVVQRFVTMDRFCPPVLTATGQTRMGAGIERALTLVEARKDQYKRHGLTYYRPWILMITDGKPEGETHADVARAGQRLREYERDKRVEFFAVGVQEADMGSLRQFGERLPLPLEGLQFRELFQWLSASMQAFSTSHPGDRVVLPPMGWLKRFMHENRESIGDLLAITTRVVLKVATGI